MGDFRLLAHPWWVNLLLLVPLVAYFLFRREKPQLTSRELLISAMFALSFGFVEGAVAIYLGVAVGLLSGHAAPLSDVARLSADLHLQQSQSLNQNALPHRPFTIIGSGFCIDPDGIIVTCGHVFNAFVYPGQGNSAPGSPIKMMAPHAMFFGGVEGTEVLMHSVSIHNAVTINGFDLCAAKLSKHPAYPEAYPALPIADYSELHEMMEIATCGYPLGEVLQDQLGTVTSSFTKGMISSIIPAQGVTLQHLRGFQLDLTATNDNSGGPVFSLHTGKVFGVLQGGAVHPGTGHAVQGLTKADPVYPLFADDVLDRLRKMPPPSFR